MNVGIGTEAEQFLFWEHIIGIFVAVRVLVISFSCFLLSLHLVLPIVRSSWASSCSFVLCFLLSFHHLLRPALSSSISSCLSILCFFMSFLLRSPGPLLSASGLPSASPCPFNLGFSCPFILCFSCSFISASLYLSSVLLVVLSSSASTYTFCSFSPSTFILCFSLSFHHDFSLSFHPLLPILHTWSSTMIKFIISSAPPPSSPPFQTFFPGAIWHYCKKQNVWT